MKISFEMGSLQSCLEKHKLWKHTINPWLGSKEVFGYEPLPQMSSKSVPGAWTKFKYVTISICNDYNDYKRNGFLQFPVYSVHVNLCIYYKLKARLFMRLSSAITNGVNYRG